MSEKNDPKATEAPPKEPAVKVTRGAELRRALVKKLPPFTLSRGGEGTVNVDPHLLDLDADEFIEPLHAVVEKDR